MKAVQWVRQTAAKLKPGRRKKIILIVCAVLLVLSGACFGALSWVSHAQLSQRAAELWRGQSDVRYAQVSAFIADNSGFTIDSVMRFRSDMDSKLIQNSIKSEKESARLWYDAFSTTTQTNVSGKSGSSQVSTTAVGGDFFMIHQFKFVSGQAFNKDDVMKDHIIIDRELAWKLFGSIDVTGFEVRVNDQPCYISGVFDRDNGWPETLTYGEEPRMFMSYDLLSAMQPGVGISCFELVLPDPVTGFAAKIADEVLDLDELSVTWVENSARFRVSSLIGVLGDFGVSTMQTKAIASPYWENAARAAQSFAVIILAFAAVLLVFPLICFIIGIVRLWRKKGRLVKYFADKRQRKQREKWEKIKEEKDRLRNLQTSDEEIEQTNDTTDEEVLL